ISDFLSSGKNVLRMGSSENHLSNFCSSERVFDDLIILHVVLIIVVIIATRSEDGYFENKSTTVFSTFPSKSASPSFKSVWAWPSTSPFISSSVWWLAAGHWKSSAKAEEHPK